MEMLSSFRGDKHEFCLVVIMCTVAHIMLLVCMEMPVSAGNYVRHVCVCACLSYSMTILSFLEWCPEHF